MRFPRTAAGRPAIFVLTAFVFLLTAISGSAYAALEPEKPEADFHGLEFRNLGPARGGRVTTVHGVIGDNLTYYMGATGGGLWKTTNAGGSWNNISDGWFKVGSIGAIAVAPSDSNVIYVGTGAAPIRGVAASHGDGVYRSRDSGQTWQHMGLFDARQISRIQVHPDNPDLLYVAAQGSPWAPTTERGVYRSKDGGATFERVLYVNDVTGASDLRLDPNNPRILYAAMWDHQRKPWEIRSGGVGSGIYKSVDGGDTWEELTEGLPDLMGKIGIAPSPARSGRVWAIVEAKEKGGLYRSDDGGKSWSHINGNRRLHARSWYYMHVFADPSDENTVYVLNSAMFRSIDGGKSVQRVSVPHGDTHDLWINPANSKNMINGNDGGATVTFDSGGIWSSIYNQSTAQIYRLSVDNQFPYRVYGGQQDNSSASMRSRGYDGSLGYEDFASVGGCETAHVAFDPDNPRFLYSGCYLGNISEVDMKNQTERDIRAYAELSFGVDPKLRKYRFNWNAPIVVSEHDPRVIYHAGNVLLKSTDRGHSWTEVSPDLTRNEEDKQGPMGRPITNEVSENYNTIFYLAESPFDAGVIWVGTDDGLIQVTRNGGGDWENVTPKGIGAAMINQIEVSPHDPDKVYAAVTRYKENDFEPMIYKTTNGGKRWRNVAAGIPKDAFVRVVREDPQRQGLLFAGTETGLYISFDDGKNWESLQLNLPRVPITDIRIKDNDLVLSTQGRGFWILDDFSPLRQMSAETRRAVLHLFAPAPGFDFIEYGRTTPGFAKNPPDGVYIYYSLAEEMDLEASELKLEIIDADGNVVRTIKTDEKKGVEGGGRGPVATLPAEKGLNRFVWALDTKPVEKISVPFQIGGFPDGIVDGFDAPPGDYTLRLSIGEETPQEQRLVITQDPRSEVSDEALKEKYDLVREAYGFVNDLHKSILTMSDLKAQIDALLERQEDNELPEDLVEAGQTLADALKSWDEAAVSRQRVFFQDALNYPDRMIDKLQGSYVTMASEPAPLPEGIKDRYQDIKADWLELRAERDTILDEQLSTFEALYKEHDLPAFLLKPLE